MADFLPAFDYVMNHEDSTRSGKVTVDSGGRTRFGIAQRFHADLPDSFYTGPKETALTIAEDLLESDYWKPLRLAELKDQTVAGKIYDMAVDMGVKQAAIYTQRAALVKEDGVIGPRTINALNAAIPGRLLDRLVLISRAHYNTVVGKNPQDAPYLHGWLKRADAIPSTAGTQAPSPAETSA